MQQTPTLTERTNKYLGEDFTNKMIGNLLGERGPVSIKDLLSGTRTNLGKKDAAIYLRQKALNMLKGKSNAMLGDRPLESWKFNPGFNLLEGRQSGGPVYASQPYLVGEAGPEIVVPKQSGTVIPNLSSIRGNLLDKANAMIKQRTGKLSQPPAPVTYTQPEQNPLTGNNMYMLDPATRSLMDWQNLVQQPATAPQPGILEQGPPEVGPAPTRPEFDFSAYQNSPWYQQPLQQGIDAIQRSAIGQGGLYSGQTAQALNQFGQDYAFSNYSPARQASLAESESDFNRWLQGGQFGLNRWLQGTLYPTQEMIRVGQNSAAGQAANALNNSQYQGNLLSNIGSAQASGMLGSGAAYSGLYNNMGNLLGNIGGMALGSFF